MDQRLAGRKAGQEMIRITQLKLRPGEDEAELYKKPCGKLRLREEDILSWKIVKKSIDARKK